MKIIFLRWAFSERRVNSKPAESPTRAFLNRQPPPPGLLPKRCRRPHRLCPPSWRWEGRLHLILWCPWVSLICEPDRILSYICLCICSKARSDFMFFFRVLILQVQCVGPWMACPTRAADSEICCLAADQSIFLLFVASQLLLTTEF